MNYLFDSRPNRPGYRLHRLEVFNWGTFDSSQGNVFRFEPEGRTSLLVGNNGSGKTTLVDAILTLLVDSRTRNYNVAAGAKKTERTTKSYIKGAYDRTSDESRSNIVKFLRPKGNHLTAISAVFREEQLDRSFTLTQILYIKSDGSDDKIFAIADEPHELKQDLAGLLKADEVRDHLKHLGYQTTKVYVEYQGWLTKRTKMRGKAIDMFNQTVAVKDIQSLNAFIRKHMLEAHDWQDKVQRLLTHFNDLSLAHQELVRARRTEELLTPVEKIGAKYRRQDEKKQCFERELDAAKTFFPVLLIDLFQPEVEKMEHDVAVMTTVVERLDRELKETRETVRQLKNEIEQVGGERLKKIPDLIKLEESHLHRKQDKLEQYRENLKVCRITDDIDSPELFQKTCDRLHQASQSSNVKLTALRAKYEESIGQKASIVKELRGERDELEVLEKRRTNLPARFSAMRSRICEDLNLDESVLPFAAELISVLPTERQWEASAEMVLRSFALSLLVPDRYYRRVREYVERNRIADAHGVGQRLDYICVGKPTESSGDRIPSQSLYHKLQFKPHHDLVPWVRGEVLRRFDYRCCESVEEFNDVSRLAMTENRHVKFGTQQYRKDDRDRTRDPRHFVLGWDNTEKKRRIVAHIRELESERTTLEDAIVSFSEQIDKLQNISRAAAAALAVTDFDSIDVNRHRNEIDALREEKKQLEESNNAVKALRKRLDNTETKEESQEKERDDRLQEKAKIEVEIEQYSKMLDAAQVNLQTSKQAGDFEFHRKMFDAITTSLGEPAVSVENFTIRTQEWETAIRQRISEIAKPLEELKTNLTGAMMKFLREFTEEADDLDASVDSLDSFLEMLEQLRREDLPRHEKKFKDRLNDQVTQEVALFNTALRQECHDIEKKIAQLNKALANVVYNRGTFMQLEPRQVRDGEIDEFRRSLRECLDESLEHTDEANESRFLRIQKLVERLSDKGRTTWRNKVIDVRNWFDFTAQEIERESRKMRSCYDGSSGQSGGEKAKLAFTILVAALAYQFDVDPTNNSPGRFQFVVIDEMFSKVDDQNAQYALKLFQQFGFQLLIVAPLDAKARVTEPFVDRYLHVVKDATTNRSQLYSMTAQEYDEVVLQFLPDGKPNTNQRITER